MSAHTLRRWRQTVRLEAEFVLEVEAEDEEAAEEAVRRDLDSYAHAANQAFHRSRGVVFTADEGPDYPKEVQ